MKDNYDVIVKVSYKIVGNDGGSDRAEKIRVEEAVPTYLNALNRARICVDGIVKELISDLDVQVTSMCDSMSRDYTLKDGKLVEEEK